MLPAKHTTSHSHNTLHTPTSHSYTCKNWNSGPAEHAIADRRGNHFRTWYFWRNVGEGVSRGCTYPWTLHSATLILKTPEHQRTYRSDTDTDKLQYTGPFAFKCTRPRLSSVTQLRTVSRTPRRTGMIVITVAHRDANATSHNLTCSPMELHRVTISDVPFSGHFARKVSCK